MIPASSNRSRFPIAAFFAALAVLPWIGLAPAQDADLDLPEPGRLKVEDPGSVAPEPGDPGADPLDFDPSPAAIPEPERLSPVPKVEVNPEGKPAAGKTIGTHCVVESDDPEIRSAFSLFADQVGDRYVALLGQPDEFREPIRVILRRAEGGVAPEGTRLSFCQIRQIEGKIRYEVWAQIATGFTKELLHDEIVRMLLARDCLNEVGVAPAGGAIVPDWLRLGVLEAMAMRERGYPTGIFAAMLKSGTFMGVEDLLIADPEPMDSISLAVYRASACAFLLTLIDQTSGPQRLRRFMADLPRDQSSVHALLNKHFPALQTSRESVEKWWALQVATLAQPGALDLLSPLETERQLAAALRFAWTEEIPESDRQREAAAAAPEVAEGTEVRGTEGTGAEGEPAEEAEAVGEKDKPRLSKLFSFFKRKKGDGDGEAEADSGGEAAAPEKEAPKKPNDPPGDLWHRRIHALRQTQGPRGRSSRPSSASCKNW
ncbi:MAG: hypothetical protein R3F11_05545 [Verrucomicrobiales bacterium]